MVVLLLALHMKDYSLLDHPLQGPIPITSHHPKNQIKWPTNPHKKISASKAPSQSPLTITPKNYIKVPSNLHKRIRNAVTPFRMDPGMEFVQFLLWLRDTNHPNKHPKQQIKIRRRRSKAKKKKSVVMRNQSSGSAAVVRRSVIWFEFNWNRIQANCAAVAPVKNKQFKISMVICIDHSFLIYLMIYNLNFGLLPIAGVIWWCWPAESE